MIVRMSAIKMEMNVARAAPATPIFGKGPTPKMNRGAKIMFKITLKTCKPTAGLMIPVARKAEPNDTRTN